MEEDVVVAELTLMLATDNEPGQFYGQPGGYPTNNSMTGYFKDKNEEATECVNSIHDRAGYRSSVSAQMHSSVLPPVFVKVTVKATHQQQATYRNCDMNPEELSHEDENDPTEELHQNYGGGRRGGRAYTDGSQFYAQPGGYLRNHHFRGRGGRGRGRGRVPTF